MIKFCISLILFSLITPPLVAKQVTYISALFSSATAISSPYPYLKSLAVFGISLIVLLIFGRIYEHAVQLKNGAPLPAVHAFDQDSIGTPLQCTYGVSTPPYMYMENHYHGMRYYWSKFLNGCKDTKKKPFRDEQRLKIIKKYLPSGLEWWYFD